MNSYCKKKNEIHVEQGGIDNGKCRQPKTQIIENNQKNPHILFLSTFCPQATAHEVKPARGVPKRYNGGKSPI